LYSLYYTLISNRNRWSQDLRLEKSNLSLMDNYEYFNISIYIQDQTLLCRTGTDITHFSG